MISAVMGLGNIGPEYDGTRHNVGLDAVRRLADQLFVTPMRERPHFQGAIAGREESDGEISEIILAWPTTFMNRSGLAIEALLWEFDLTPGDLLVVVDDFNLPLGSLRFREKGSDGGHKGLISIIEAIDTDEFARLRLGIGPPTDKDEVTDFVLGRFTEDEREIAERMVAKASEAIIFALSHRLDEAMSQFNSNPAPSDESETDGAV